MLGFLPINIVPLRQGHQVLGEYFAYKCNNQLYHLSHQPLMMKTEGVFEIVGTNSTST